jgi:hypothetical protein
MNDTELRTRLLELPPAMPAPANPMALLRPRIKRRRLARRALAGVLAGVLAGTAVAIGMAVLPGDASPPKGTLISTAIHPVVGHRYAGPPFPDFGHTPMWVVAHGRLGGHGSPWVLVNYVRKGRSCTLLGLVPTHPRARTTEPVGGGCAPGPHEGTPVFGFDEVGDRGGARRVLASDVVPSDVVRVRATVSRGSVLNATVPTGQSPVDPEHRHFVIDAGRHGFVGTVTFFDSSGHVVGHEHWNARPPRQPPGGMPVDCPGGTGFWGGAWHCLGHESSWVSSPYAIAGYALAGAVVVIVVPVVVVRRRRANTGQPR